MIDSSPNPVVWYLLIAAAIGILLIGYGIRRLRPSPGLFPAIVLMFGVIIWTGGNAAEMAFTTFETKVFFSNAQYVGITIIPVAWFIFALEYTGHDLWLTPRKRWLLAIEPTVVVLLAFTSDYQSLFKSNFVLRYSGNYPLLDADLEVAFWIHAVYSYLLLLIGTIVLLRAFLRSPVPYRGQIIWLLIGAVTPWVVNIAYVLGFEPIPHTDLTPLAFTVTILAIAWSLHRHRLFDIVPVARERVIEHMGDAVIVLDAQDRIVDVNQSGARIIGAKTSDIIGSSAAAILLSEQNLADQLNDVVTGESRVIAVTKQDKQYSYDTHSTLLTNRAGQPTGRAIVLRDVSQHKAAENQLRALIAAMDDIILVLDDTGRYLRIESAHSEHLVKPRDELLGKTLSEIFPKPQAENFLAHIHKALEVKQTVTLEYSLSINTATEWFHTTISPLDDTSVLWVIRNITSRKTAEIELSAYRDRLEELVEERTAQLRKTNLLLEEEITERTRVEEVLKQTLARQETLLQEVHHRVKNNLQVVASLLNLQSGTIATEQPDPGELFRESQNRIHAMAMVHEQLYRSQDMVRIACRPYITGLVSYIKQSYGAHAQNIRLNVNVTVADVHVQVAIPCGLIINELVSNAFKYGFPDGRHGEVDVDFHQDDTGQHLLTVRDNGVGFPTDQNVEKADTLGLQLVDSLVHQLHGSLHTEHAGGTKVQIAFEESGVIDE